jgi:predicted O-methyltransferase YrrM
MSLVVPDVAIVTHNTDYYLLNLLNSLEPMRATGSIGEIHVWDNGSTDETAALLGHYQAARPWVRVRRSQTNLHHGPALDRLLRESCRRDWVLLLDSDTEVERSFATALQADALANATFVGQLHPQMPHLYAYLAHLLVHRPRYLKLPPFRHHGAPGVDYFRAIEQQGRPFVRFRWCDYVHHFGQGALRRLIERDDRSNEFYEFARNQAQRHPTSAARRDREHALRDDLRRFLQNARPTTTVTAPESVADDAPPRAATIGRRPARESAIVRQSSRWRQAFARCSPRRARAFRAARRLGLTQIPAEAAELMRIVEHHQPRRVLEIGTAHGGSLLLWARAAATEAILVSIDLPPWELDDPGEPAKRLAIERVGSARQLVHAIRGNSHDAGVRSRALGLLGGEAVDFLFIDGDHSYEGVRGDYRDYACLVKPGGVIAFHDIHPHSRGWGGEVPRFWREVREGHRFVEVIADRAQDGYGLGVIWIGS